MFSARKTSFLVDLSIRIGFLSKIKRVLLFRIFTALRGKFDGVYLQGTNKARKHLMTPHFLGIF